MMQKNTTRSLGRTLVELLFTELDSVQAAESGKEAWLAEGRLRALATAARAAVHVKTLLGGEGADDRDDGGEDMETLHAELERRIARLRGGVERAEGDAGGA
jgi:hypothetical protein